MKMLIGTAEEILPQLVGKYFNFPPTASTYDLSLERLFGESYTESFVEKEKTQVMLECTMCNTSNQVIGKIAIRRSSHYPVTFIVHDKPKFDSNI